MDYQILCMLQLALALLSTFLSNVNGIVGRDLLLTPKQGLQLNGRSIYYEDDETATMRNQTARAWERTLKHVTYVTLFTSAAADAAAGNISKLRAYNDFMHSPYIIRHTDNDARFGDIVTLASGRLEETANKTFRFVEGQCDYACDAERVWALWQVQKIRHRDVNRKFRYEMKFSVSPLHVEGVGNSKRKAELSSSHKRNALQTYIQRDDDYPQSFGRIVYADEAHFAERRLDDYMSRNFRHTPATAMNSYRPATPMPQSTFMHNIFQPLPHFPPLPEKLNIGEYIKDFPAKATPKIELFPNIMNTVSRSHFPTPTTFRPNYQMKLPRPEFYQPPPIAQHEPVRFPESSNEHLSTGKDGTGKLNTPMVTHHFHHHFYMPSSSSIENGINSSEQLTPNVATTHKQQIADVTPAYFNNFYAQTARYQQSPHTTQQYTYATPQLQSTPPEIYKQHVVQVTPVPPLKKPHIYQTYPIQVGAKVPLLIYPAPVEEEAEEQPALKSNKPFIRSEPIEVEPIRYSEPDPLYLNLAHNPRTDEQSYELNASQLEAPKVEEYTGVLGKHAKPDSIAAQLPPPDKDQDVRIPYVDDEAQETSSKTKHDQVHNPSQQKLRISTTQTHTTTAPTELTHSATIMPSTSTTSTSTSTTASKPLATVATKQHEETITASASSVRTTATPSTNTLHSATTAVPSTIAIESATKPSKHQFVSTSTSETPLRAISRYRLKFTRSSTTTTEQPVLKWKPRRKHNSKLSHVKVKSQDSKAKGSLKHEEKLPPLQVSMGKAHDSNETTASPQSTNEIFEVLTQKSVSKSVSIKVGSNGEEIPIILEDDSESDGKHEEETADNEVKPTE